MKIFDINKIIIDLENLKGLTFSITKFNNKYYVFKKDDKYTDDFSKYFLSKKFPLYGFACEENPHSMTEVELYPYTETTNGRFLKSSFFNILDFEIGKVAINVSDNCANIYNGKYSIEIWKNLYSHQYGHSFKNLLCIYNGFSFSNARFITNLYFLDIFLRYQLIGSHDIKFRYFEAFKYFIPISAKKIYETIKELEIESRSTTITRIGKDNEFITEYFVRNLPTTKNLKMLVISYYETFNGYKFNIFLSKIHSHYAYSPAEADEVSITPISEFQIADIYRYVLENYNYEIDRTEFYDLQLKNIIEKMKLKIQKDQIWGSKLEKFKVIAVEENKLTLYGLTDVEFLQLKQGHNCMIDKKTLESFLDLEMKMFDVILD